MIAKRQIKLKVLYDKNIGLSKKLEQTAYHNQSLKMNYSVKLIGKQ
jgi:hypothetical protein